MKIQQPLILLASLLTPSLWAQDRTGMTITEDTDSTITVKKMKLP